MKRKPNICLLVIFSDVSHPVSSVGALPASPASDTVHISPGGGPGVD